MLKIYWNELKKLKRKKMTMTLFAIGFLLPAFSVLLCVHSNYRFRNLVGMNELFGSFLIVPFLFSVQFLSLFEMEEHTRFFISLRQPFSAHTSSMVMRFAIIS